MPLFNKPDDSVPDTTPAELEFPSAKKGWDPVEVRQYIDGLLDQHEEDLGAVVGRLRTVQGEHEQFSQSMAQQVKTLEEARDHAIARAEEFEQVLKQAQAEVDQSAHDRVQELETQLAEAQAAVDRAHEDVDRAHEEAQAARGEAQTAHEQLAAQPTKDEPLVAELRSKLDAADEYVQQATAVYDERDRLLGEIEALRTNNSSEHHEARIRAEEQVRVLEEELRQLRSEADNPLLQQASAQAVATLEAEVRAARDQAETAETRAQEARTAAETYQRSYAEIDVLRADLEGRLNTLVDDVQHRDGELDQLRAKVDEATRAHHEALRQAAAAEAETQQLQREVTRLREENPSISDTARRMQAALEELQRKHEDEMATVLAEAHHDADQLRENAAAEAAEATRSTIVELEQSIARYADQLKQAQATEIAAQTERAASLDALHGNVGALLQSMQDAYGESFSFLREQHAHEHAVLVRAREDLLSEISGLEARRGELVSQLTSTSGTPATDMLSPVDEEDEPTTVDDGVEQVAALSSADEAGLTDTQDTFAASAADLLDSPTSDPFANKEELPQPSRTFQSSFDGELVELSGEDASTEVETVKPAPFTDAADAAAIVDIDLDQPITVGREPVADAPNEPTVEPEPEPEPVYTPPASHDVWAGFSSETNTPAEETQPESLEPLETELPAPPTTATDHRPSISDLANLSVPQRDRDESVDHDLEKTDELAPRIFTEDD